MLPPGLRYLPGWLTPGEERDLAGRIDAAGWSEELRRRVQHYGHRYDYGRRGLHKDEPVAPLPPWARDLARRLADEEHFDAVPDQVIVNEYEPGQGIAPHVDCVPCFGPVVASVSLLSACVMEFTEPDGGTRVPVRLEQRGLCVMTGPSRFTWRHGIAARKTDPGADGRVPRGRRVSVTFRTVLH
ncbi:alpha-ketoglutarate-dependent dioxygenase AlkB [Spirillospora sp. CA-142024]|uniref:alpha-ketoglutarate-dependent dioxygenase AlkB n=1 Tax=Spirillospora sp. CA-142024 TaxID=3240036 RepID=UPI003D92DC7E